jgi:site-specific recombinase XerD
VATLRERNGVYFIDYRVNGRRLRKCVGKSKKIADLALKDIELQIAKGEIGLTPKDQNLNTLFQEFLNYCHTNLSPNSQKRYKAIINHFETFLGQYPYLAKISHLSPKTLEDYKAFRKSQEAANKTVNIELQTLKSMFNLAVKWGYAKENPARGVKPLKEDNHKKPRFLSKEEINKLLDNSGSDLYPIFYTFLYTGMRKSELENLEWDDVDFDRKRVKIRIKDGWRPKTSEREIPISNGLLELLKNHKKETKNGRYVFHKNGERIEPNNLRKKLISVARRCGLKDLTKLHTLRHTFASQLVMSGVDLPTVKKLMGHADIETTMIYSHLADEHIDKAIDKLNF